MALSIIDTISGRMEEMGREIDRIKLQLNYPNEAGFKRGVEPLEKLLSRLQDAQLEFEAQVASLKFKLQDLEATYAEEVRQ